MKLYPEIIVLADVTEQSISGYRIWFIAKDFCGGRANTVPVKAFRAYLRALGVSRASYNRWIKNALNTGLFKLIESKRKVSYYELASWQRGAYLAGCERLSKPVKVNRDDFLGRKWKSYVWGAYLSTFGDKPIARETIEKITSVPERTQRYRERSGRVKQVENVAIHGNVLDNPDLVERLYNGYGFGYYIDDEHNLCQRLPNSKVAPDGVKSAKLGRTKKVNKALSSLLLNDAVEPKVETNRRYSDNFKQTRRIIRSLKRRDDIRGEVTIYERVRTSYNGSGVYQAVIV